MSNIDFLADKSLKYSSITLFLSTILCLITCSITPTKPDADINKNDTLVANVIQVQANGNPGSYIFYVTIQSPDTGCGQYADWWEVLSAEGALIYRRILTHSHVSEQPFTRSGGPLAVTQDARVYIRAHMHPTGYGGSVFSGSAHSGFAADSLAPLFDPVIETREPQPNGCAF